VFLRVLSIYQFWVFSNGVAFHIFREITGVCFEIEVKASRTLSVPGEAIGAVIVGAAICGMRVIIGFQVWTLRKKELKSILFRQSRKTFQLPSSLTSKSGDGVGSGFSVVLLLAAATKLKQIYKKNSKVLLVWKYVR